MKQRPRIAAARGVCDTVSHWRTMTARSHMPAGPGCQRGVGLLWASPRGKSYDNSHQGHRGWALSSTIVAFCHSTEAKQAVMTSQLIAIVLCVLTQHGSKAGSNDKSVNCNSFVHAWPESSGTAAEDCRREGCIRHRLTLAHQDGPKPHASRARLPEGGWSSMGQSKGKKL